MAHEEIRKVEEIANDIVSRDLKVECEEMPRIEAERSGALSFFKAKYGNVVKVYYVGPNIKEAISKEFCGGPHIDRTSKIGRIEITKEEAVAAGIRRIRAVVE